MNKSGHLIEQILFTILLLVEFNMFHLVLLTLQFSFIKF